MSCAVCGSAGLTNGRCSSCGAIPELQRCAGCSRELVPDGRYCAHCGRPVDRDLTSLWSPVPEHILKSLPSSVVGERRRVTVLQADMAASTERTSKLDPEDAMAVIAPFMQILMDAAHAHNGFVNATRGDGVIALFGAPLVNEEHAVDACAAALAMRKAVAAWAGTSEGEAALRIGLCSGEVVIQAIGSDLSMNFEVAGNTAHIAARLEKAGGPGSILISDATRALVRGQMHTEAREAVVVEGLAEPVAAFALISAAPLSRWQARKSLGLSTFEGRHKHLSALTAMLPAVERGSGRIVTVTAPAGIGKSRLVHEFLDNLPPGWRVMQTACSPHRTTSSYHPIAQLIRDLFKLAPGDGDEAIEARLTRALLHEDASLKAHIPAFLSVLDVRTTNKAWGRLDPVERRINVLEAAITALTSSSQAHPLLLVLEDAHWCDPETRHILETLAARIGGMRLMIIVTQRPEGGVHIPEVAGAVHLALEPLAGEAALALARSLLGDDISIVPLKQRILQLADGNPLFIEELVHDLRDRGHLVGARGDYRLAGAVDALRLPDSVQAVIGARIDQLDAARKAVLQTAAVVGRKVPLRLLAHMLERPPESLTAALDRLEAAQLLRPEAGSDGQTYMFKHELIREVAYQTLRNDTRRTLHGKAVGFIEATYAERLEEHIDALADHAFRAQLWAKALPYQMRSARRALRRGANHEAIALCERAQETLTQLPASADRTKAEIDFALAGIIALEPVGRHKSIAALLTSARDKAFELGEPWRIAAVTCQLVVALWRVGRHDEAMKAAASAEAAANRLGDAALIFAARHNTGIVHHETGDFAAAVTALRACLDMETPDIEAKRVGWAALPSVVLRTFLADSLYEMGEVDEARRVGEEGIARATDAGHAYSRVQINQVRSRIMLADGRAGEAIEMLAADWRTSVELDMVQMHPIIASRLGEAHLACGNIGAALDVLARPERLDVPVTENAFGWRYLFLARGHAYLRGGRLDDATLCARRALALAKERMERPQAAYAHDLLGAIARADGQGRQVAKEHWREAARLADACGMRPLAARCRAQMMGGPGLLARVRSWLLPPF